MLTTKFHTHTEQRAILQFLSRTFFYLLFVLPSYVFLSIACQQ